MLAVVTSEGCLLPDELLSDICLTATTDAFLRRGLLTFFTSSSSTYSDDDALRNSLIETNLGLPFLYLIHKAISNRFSTALKFPATQ